MLLDINPHSGVPIYRQILIQIKRSIMAGRLKPGDKLPSVRHLAGQLKVNPMTISKVYSFLENDGFVTRQRGVGLFVEPISPESIEDKAGDLLSDTLFSTVSLALELGISKEMTIEMLEKVFENKLQNAKEALK